MHDYWRFEGPFDDMPYRVIEDMPDGDYIDEFHDVTGWQIWHSGHSIAEVLAPPNGGPLELWHEGDMVEVTSPARALEALAASLSVQRFARALYWNKRN